MFIGRFRYLYISYFQLTTKIFLTLFSIAFVPMSNSSELSFTFIVLSHRAIQLVTYSALISFSSSVLYGFSDVFYGSLKKLIKLFYSTMPSVELLFEGVLSFSESFTFPPSI